MFLIPSDRMEEVPKILWIGKVRPLRRGRGWPLKNALPPHVYYRASFGRSGSNVTNVTFEMGPSRLAIQSQLKVIGTDWDRSATYDFLLVIHSNHGPISYRFRDKRRFQSKLANCPHPLYLTPPLRGFPLKFCNGGENQKPELCPTGLSKSSTTSAFVDTILTLDRDRRTDRQKWQSNIALCMLCMPTRNKKRRIPSIRTIVCAVIWWCIIRCTTIHNDRTERTRHITYTSHASASFLYGFNTRRTMHYRTMSHII